jgi:hypothetical protein
VAIGVEVLVVGVADEGGGDTGRHLLVIAVGQVLVGTAAQFHPRVGFNVAALQAVQGAVGVDPVWASSELISARPPLAVTPPEAADARIGAAGKEVMLSLTARRDRFTPKRLVLLPPRGCSTLTPPTTLGYLKPLGVVPMSALMPSSGRS